MTRLGALVLVGVSWLAAGQADAGELFEPGARVRLRLALGTTIADDGVPRLAGSGWLYGRLLTLESDGTVVVDRGGRQPLRLSLADVSAFEVSRGPARKRRALMGAAVGAAIGLLLGGVEASACEQRSAYPSLCGLAYGAPILTAPIGALIGRHIGRESWAQVTYKGATFGVLPGRHGLRLTCAF